MKRITGLFFSILLLSAIGAFSCTEELDVLPKLKTKTAVDSDITTTTALLKGEVLSVGNQIITKYGVELADNQLFNNSVQVFISGSPSAGVFEVSFSGLNPGTKYYFKAYALINTAEVYADNVENFTTKL